MKLNDLEIARICRGLSLLLHGGIFLSDGVFLLAAEETGSRKELLSTMGRAMDQGASLAQAMERSGAFPEHVVGMTAIGEKTGRLEHTLESLSAFYEERERTLRQIKSALTYPAVILVLMLGVIGVLLIRVLPVFDRVYASLGSQLTGTAAGLLRLGQLLEANLPVFLLLMTLLGIGILLYRLVRPFRSAMQALALAGWGDRGVLRRYNNTRCARALALGLYSGLPLEEALTMAQTLLSDVPQAARRCARCASALEGGAALAQAMGEADILSPSLCQLLSVGMHSGSADQVMQTIADRLAEEAQTELERTVAKIEPAMVVLCALLVGAILLSVMLPLMGILSAIG